MEHKNTEVLQKTKMSTIGVVAIVFSFVAAGAFGIEEAISSSGPGITLALLVIFPFVWCFPVGEMVAELGSLLPTEGGVYSWGRESFGEFWGWQVGLWSALTTWLCQAEYCALVAGYAAKLIDLSPAASFAVKVAVVIVFSIINIIGLDWLEKTETFFTVLVVAAFAAVAIVGFCNWQFNPFEPIFNEEEGLFSSIGNGIAIIVWMYMGYECMSNMAGAEDEIADAVHEVHVQRRGLADRQKSLHEDEDRNAAQNQQRPHQPASLGKQLPQTHPGLFGGRDFGGLQKCNHNVRKIIYLSSCLFSPRRKRPYRPAPLCAPNRPHAGVRAAAAACGGCGTCFSTAL